MTTILDLTKDVPRSPFEQLEGFAWLPRMIDKARALFAGSIGDYSPYPCPGDQGFLKYFQLDAKPLGELIKGGATDQEIVDYVKAHSPRSQADKEAFAARQRVPEEKLLYRLALMVFKRKLRRQFQAKYPNHAFSQINSFAKMLALEEGHTILGL